MANEDSIRKIMVDGDVVELVKLAEKTGQTLAEQRLTTNQIRNVFGTVRQIQMRWPNDPQRAYRDAILLRPKLAYFAEREKKAKGNSTPGMETLQGVLEPAFDYFTQNGTPSFERFERFAELFEAIVAYHKRYESTAAKKYGNR